MREREREREKLGKHTYGGHPLIIDKDNISTVKLGYQLLLELYALLIHMM
jgi:hypothetical protein